jgi:hypothetical protein
MKTIKQIADELGVTRQAVQKRISREPLCTELKAYMYTKESTKYIDETGVKLMKTAFEENEVATSYATMYKVADNHVYSNVYSDVHGNAMRILQDKAKVLEQQLVSKDRQIEGLIDVLQKQAESESGCGQPPPKIDVPSRSGVKKRKSSKPSIPIARLMKNAKRFEVDRVEVLGFKQDEKCKTK